MANYQIYRLDGLGRLTRGERFDAEDDEAAIAAARKLRGQGACELWCGGRIVGRFSRLGEFSRDAS